MLTEQDLLQDLARALYLTVETLPANLTDPQLEKSFDLASGTVSVKRARGDFPIPSYKIGRSRRTPLSAVIQYKLKQIHAKTRETERGRK